MRIDPFPFEYARLTVKRYVCSTCWGELELFPDEENEGKYIVLCKVCKENTVGYVSQMYVERRRGESVGEAVEVRKLLIRLGILPNPLAGKSKDDLLRELGY